VLTRSQLLTFRDERRYVEPTEVIDVKDLAAIVLSTAQRWPTLTLSTAKCAFVFCTSARSTTETPSLHSWSRQLRALRCIGGERSLIASLPDDVLSCVFELLPSSSSTAGTCRKVCLASPVPVAIDLPLRTAGAHPPSPSLIPRHARSPRIRPDRAGNVMSHPP
jgi:hypothetical protein